MAKTKKLRRHSGRITPKSTLKIPKKRIIAKCLEPKEHYSEWDNYRDGCRGTNDHTKLRNKNIIWSEYLEVERWNKKIKKQIKVRKARKKKLS